MDRYAIQGGIPLNGEVEIGGAKNAALAIVTAAVMTDDPVTIENVPDVTDVNIILKAMEGIGAKIEHLERHTVRIDASGITDCVVEDENVKRIRASYYLVGALLGKRKRRRFLSPADAISASVR